MLFLILGSVVTYVAVGLVAGQICSRYIVNSYRKGWRSLDPDRGRYNDTYEIERSRNFNETTLMLARNWGVTAIPLWPVFLGCTVVWGFFYGLWKVCAAAVTPPGKPE